MQRTITPPRAMLSIHGLMLPLCFQHSLQRSHPTYYTGAEAGVTSAFGSMVPLSHSILHCDSASFSSAIPLAVTFVFRRKSCVSFLYSFKWATPVSLTLV